MKLFENLKKRISTKATVKTPKDDTVSREISIEENQLIPFNDVPRVEADFLRHHEFTVDQEHATKHALSQIHLPGSISSMIISFLDAPYLRSYCKLSLSFKSKNDDLFHDFLLPDWLASLRMEKGWFSIIAYAMGTCNSLYELDEWETGSSWDMEWGELEEFDAYWIPHYLYESDKIKQNKTEVPKQTTSIKFHMIPHRFSSDESVFDFYYYNDEMIVFGNVAVLCVDYRNKTSLENAEKYAMDIVGRNRFKVLFIVVVDCEDKLYEKDSDYAETKYFEWKDVVSVAQTYNASCFEVSTNIDDNTIFVYNQFVFEYAYWHCLNRGST
eukprot:757778_1